MNFSRLARCVICLLAAFTVLPAAAWIRSPAVNFAALPAKTAHPEGITADAQGNIYVADFDVTKASGPGNVIVFDHAGKLLRTLDVKASSPLLLGLAFQPGTNALLVLDFGAGNVLNVDPQTGDASVFAAIGPPMAHGINGLTFDPAGNVYVSDSFAGTIWQIPAGGGSATVWVTHPLLATQGVPPFGANGLAFNNEHTAMFVANTGNDTIVQIPILDVNFNPGTPTVFVNSINGADGLIIDGADNLWVAANQADEIVVVEPSGRVIAKLGDFEGIDPNGMAKGLLFPASLVFSGGFLYVTNLALDLNAALSLPTVDSPWAAEVTRFNVARIPARIPPIH